MRLDSKALIPCTSSASALTEEEIDALLNELNNWCLMPGNSTQKISKRFTFKNYLAALKFTNLVAALAEQENHHPRICIEWGKVTIDWRTHSINGLFIYDFIMAARCDNIFSELR